MSRILHVEDEPVLASALARGLKRSGFDVVSVPTASGAALLLDWMRQDGESFDFVLSDFNLGEGRTGADVLAAAGSTPFLFLTSDDRAEGRGVPRLDKPSPLATIRAALDALKAVQS